METKKNVLITGSTGFIGQELIKQLTTRNFTVKLLRRGDLETTNDLFSDLNYVVHLAGRAHDRGATWADFQINNVDLTNKLLEKVKNSSPKPKFIFISSAKVYGEVSAHAFKESDEAAPLTDYGCSKLMAEKSVQESGLPFIVFRPSLVYSEHAKGNLQTLRKISKLGIPLPSNIENHRSLATLDFVVKQIIRALEEELPWYETYNLADLCLSTSEIFKMSGIRFFVYYPQFVFKFLPSKLKEKLLYSFEISSQKLQDVKIENSYR